MGQIIKLQTVLEDDRERNINSSRDSFSFRSASTVMASTMLDSIEGSFFPVKSK